MGTQPRPPPLPLDSFPATNIDHPAMPDLKKTASLFSAVLIAVCLSGPALAAVDLVDPPPGTEAFPLVSAGKAAAIVLPPDAPEVVKIAARDLAADIADGIRRHARSSDHRARRQEPPAGRTGARSRSIRQVGGLPSLREARRAHHQRLGSPRPRLRDLRNFPTHRRLAVELVGGCARDQARRTAALATATNRSTNPP